MKKVAVAASGATSPSLMGRPRSNDAHHAMLDAALATLTEMGAAGVTVQAICDRSGCSRATFYRRWPTAWDCIAESTHWKFRPKDLELREGTLSDTLTKITMDLYSAFLDPSIRALYGVVLIEGDTRPELSCQIKEYHQSRRLEMCSWLAVRMLNEGLSLRISENTFFNLLTGIALNAAFTDIILSEIEIRQFIDIAMNSTGAQN